MNIKPALRWCAVPFASIIGSFIAYLLIALWIRGNNYGFELYNGEEVGSITQIILAIAAQAVVGLAFVFCGATVAPKHKRTCAVILASVFCTLTVVGYIYSLIIDGFVFLQLVHVIASIAGAIGAANSIQPEEPDIHTEGL